MKWLFFPVIIILLFLGCSSEKEDYKTLVEITDTGYRISDLAFLDFLEEFDIDTSEVYQWENHRLLLLNPKKVEAMKLQLDEKFPGAVVKIFSKPFYVFDSKNCSGAVQSDQNHNYIFTANLVADTVKQREYMEYHARQSVDWPAVAQGFCNAGFQQLLVYRTSRQLILIIRIPADKTLDELNPKTVENNPEMVEWNRMMAAYQEGIEQAPDGVVWVQYRKYASK
jgi:L-rhamnose mutarotase